MEHKVKQSRCSSPKLFPGDRGTKAVYVQLAYHNWGKTFNLNSHKSILMNST